MTKPDCLTLRRKARRSGRFRANACLLLAEICDLHGCEKGCIMENDTLADRLNCTERSIRDWLRELKSEGIIMEGQEGPNRVLQPRVPSWMEWKEDSTEEATFQENTEDSRTDVPERNEDSKEDGKDFPPQRDNNSEGTGEAAHAHEADAEKAVRIFTQQVRSLRELYEEEKKIKRHTDWNPEKLNVWRKVCYETYVDMKDASKASLKYLFQDFDEKWSEKQQDERSMMDRMPGPPVNAN